MKYLILFFTLFFSFTSFSQSKDEKAIRLLLAEQTSAWNNGDIDGFMKGYWHSDSLLFIGKSGVTYGWNNTLKNYKKGYPDKSAMGNLSFDLLIVRKLSKNYYYVVGKWFLRRSIGDIGGHYNLLFRKINGEWVIVADYSS